MNHRGNCWPTPDQELLLEAALLEPTLAKKAWQSYCSRFDLQKIDPVSTTLLPLVYHNLKGDPSVDVQIPKSLYRYTWSSNHLQLFKLNQTLKLLHTASIQTCLLKGAALVLQYYKEAGVRVMGDVDLLVDRSQAKNTISSLLDAGWECKNRLQKGGLDRFIQRSHALMLCKEGFNLDLHWSLLAESGIDPKLANYTYQLSPFPLSNGEITHILSPEDQLVHILFHGLQYSPSPLIRWIPDSSMILKKTKNFRWNYFLSQARELKLEYPFYTALSYLQNHHFAPIPELEKKRYIAAKKELSYYQFITQKPKKLLHIFLLYWHAHSRNSNSERGWILLLTLPLFLKKVKKINYWHQIIPFFFRGLWIHFRKDFLNFSAAKEHRQGQGKPSPRQQALPE